MEELENKLNSDNPILVSQIISKIINKIKDTSVQAAKESTELKFLKDKCMSPDPLISETAGAGIIHLVECGVLQAETTLAYFITTIPLTKCYLSLTNIIGDLFRWDINHKVKSSGDFKSPYNLCVPQHPFITLLNNNESIWIYIFNKIKFLYDNENRECVTELVKPVFLYVLCSPSQNQLDLFKQKLWTFLLNSQKLDDELFYNLLCWMQVQTKNSIEINSELLEEALNYISCHEECSLDIELLILWMTSVLHSLALNKLDIRSSISCLKNVLLEVENVITLNCLLLMLSKTVEVCSPVYLRDLLSLCKILISFDVADMYILQALKASLLQWLINPSLLTEEANKSAHDIFMCIDMKGKSQMVPNYSMLKDFSIKYNTIISTNRDVFLSVELCLFLQNLKEENIILKWLDNIENISYYFVKDIVHFFCGLLLAPSLSSTISKKIILIILKTVEHSKIVTTKLLTIILYKLSNTKDPQLHFYLLKTLPKMVILRENTPRVVVTLQALSKGSTDLYNFSLSLMCDAWKIDNKCYTYLESMLSRYDFKDKKWETSITKAYVLKEICQKKPELYGKDMVAHLSKILNECNDDDGSLPCALAIEGITVLCKAEVIDVVTTWATLSPKFKRDIRVPVIKSLCSLISEIPSLPYAEAYSKLNEEVVAKLWEYSDLGIPEISESAFSSLALFSLEQICAQLPEHYLDDKEMQKNITGTQLIVPGNTWIKFLMENQASKAACNFIIKMISTEVANYLKYIYQVKGSREPINYGYLPTHSIVRGIGEFIRTWATKWKGSLHDILYIECLKIFSVEYSKPLPPQDWCFLQELIHEPRVKNYCVDIASHQVTLSGTARRLIENYIFAVSQNPQEKDILNVFKNLKYLVNSIQPVILKPFFETAFSYSLKKFNEHEKYLLLEILEFIKNVLRDDSILETNKVTIAQVLSDKISTTNATCELFTIVVQAVIALPSKYIEEMTSLKSNISEEWVEKVAKIRCSTAINTKILPLNWLNEVIDVSSKLKRNFSIMRKFSEVFKQHVGNSAECALWLLELVGQIQAKVADRCDSKEVTFYFDVLMLAVVEFSGYVIFIMDDYSDFELRIKDLFPQALVALLDTNDWSICTSELLEWLYHMNSEKTISSKYRNIFGITLQSSRHDDEFTKKLKWTKYLNSKANYT